MRHRQSPAQRPRQSVRSALASRPSIRRGRPPSPTDALAPRPRGAGHRHPRPRRESRSARSRSRPGQRRRKQPRRPAIRPQPPLRAVVRQLLPRAPASSALNITRSLEGPIPPVHAVFDAMRSDLRPSDLQVSRGSLRLSVSPEHTSRMRPTRRSSRSQCYPHQPFPQARYRRDRSQTQGVLSLRTGTQTTSPFQGDCAVLTQVCPDFKARGSASPASPGADSPELSAGASPAPSGSDEFGFDCRYQGSELMNPRRR